MKSLKFFLAVLFFISANSIFAQNVYPDATNHCYLDQFILETDSIVAKIDKQKIIDAVTSSWDGKMKKKIEGVLGLQILVNNRGQSCLVSYRNDTNQKLKNLNLENNINDNLKWPRQAKKVSTIVIMEFQKGEITVRRMGTKDRMNLFEFEN